MTRPLLPVSCLLAISWILSPGPLRAEPPTYLTFDNTPLGTLEQPLILRTYMPDPGLADEVFSNEVSETKFASSQNVA